MIPAVGVGVEHPALVAALALAAPQEELERYGGVNLVNETPDQHDARMAPLDEKPHRALPPRTHRTDREAREREDDLPQHDRSPLRVPV